MLPSHLESPLNCLFRVNICCRSLFLCGFQGMSDRPVANSPIRTPYHTAHTYCSSVLLQPPIILSTHTARVSCYNPLSYCRHIFARVSYFTTPYHTAAIYCSSVLFYNPYYAAPKYCSSVLLQPPIILPSHTARLSYEDPISYCPHIVLE